MGYQIGIQARRVVDPSDGRGTVARRQYAILVVCFEALEPNIDRHSYEFEEVVDQSAAAEDAFLGDPDLPSSNSNSVPIRLAGPAVVRM